MDEAGERKKDFQPDSDVHVTLEDQKKINNFARCNAKYNDIQTELATKRSELKNLEDATEELILMDESTTPSIPFLHGEIFVCLNLFDTQNTLENEKKKVSTEIADLEETSEKLKSVLNTLRTQLYAKFGNHISLGQ